MTVSAVVSAETYTFRFTTAEKRILRAKEKITVSQCAERYRVVTNGPKPGRWSNEETPYLVEPMDVLNLPWVRKVILCFAPQTGKTQVPFNFLVYAAGFAPGPAMYIMPDERVTKRISRRRIIPMFRRTPLTAEVMSPRAEETTMYAVQFMNGMDLMMAWATSAAEMASESVQYLIFDECDKFPEFTGKEADPFSLGEDRTITYPHTSKILYLSTPTTEDGAITKIMNKEADEVREYEVKCPICSAMQIMVFEQFTWPVKTDPREISRKRLAHYACKYCGMHWDEHMRNQAVKNGRWVAENPVERPAAIGFHLPSWYSPFMSLSKVVADYLRGQEDPSKRMAFVTQHEAKPFKETITPQKESTILEHKTDIPSLIVPKTAIALTCGIDVQLHGFYFVVRAWSPDLTNWLVQYGFLAAFRDVETLLFETEYKIQGSTRTMAIWRSAIDTGGGDSEDGEWTRTEEIYQWLRKNKSRGLVFGTKGASRRQYRRVEVKFIDKMARGNRPIPGGLELRFLDTDQFKRLYHWRLDRKEGESQRLFLHAETGEDYAKQILAEELRRDKRGRMKWKRLRDDNHYLDCEVMAAACADSEWLPSLKMLAAGMEEEPEEDREEEQEEIEQPRVLQSNWMKR